MSGDAPIVFVGEEGMQLTEYLSAVVADMVAKAPRGKTKQKIFQDGLARARRTVSSSCGVLCTLPATDCMAGQGTDNNYMARQGKARGMAG